MRCTDIPQLIAKTERHIQTVWLDEPPDIFNIKHGYLGSEAGVDGQYFSPLVMLSGEMRCLGTHVFADLCEFCKQDDFTVDLLKVMTRRMISTDVGVIKFFGLREYGRLLINFDELVDEIKDKEEFARIIELMFVLTNRYQMWLHQIFPWGYGKFMPKRTPAELRSIGENMLHTGEQYCQRA